MTEKAKQEATAEQSEITENRFSMEDSTMWECWLVHPIDDSDCVSCPSVRDCREVRQHYETTLRRAISAEADGHLKKGK